MKSNIWPMLFLLFVVFVGNAQEKKYKVKTVAFYNVENLFDTINDPRKFDDDRTPTGKDNWTTPKYKDKLEKLAKVISEIGEEFTKTPPAIIGVCEIENKDVLIDLVNQEKLKSQNYGIVHFDSPDERGIDVALLYKKSVFTPISSKSHTLYLYYDNGEKRDYTRDQLVVSGTFDGEEMHFIVNHWPSRSGGEARSRSKREAAAALNKKIIDSLQKINPKAKIMSMGDLNDDPTNSSLKKVLETKSKKKRAKGKDLYNPMEEMVKKGVGSLAWRDSWNLFDQIFFTAELLDEDKSSYRFWKAKVFNERYLFNKSGRYKGYPFRSYANGNYTGGYSDHFPVYIYLIKEAE